MNELHELIRGHYDAILAYYGERTGVPLARKHLAWYFTGFDGAAAFRSEINQIKDADDVKRRIDEFFVGQEALAA